MLKISQFDSRNQHRLIVEGKLIAPWIAKAPIVVTSNTKGTTDSSADTPSCDFSRYRQTRE